MRAIIYRAREEESRRRSLDRSIRLLDRAIALVETRRVTPYQFEDAGETYGEMLKDVRRGLIEQLDKVWMMDKRGIVEDTSILLVEANPDDN